MNQKMSVKCNEQDETSRDEGRLTTTKSSNGSEYTMDQRPPRLGTQWGSDCVCLPPIL